MYYPPATFGDDMSSGSLADPGIEFGRGTWRARGARAYNGDLGAEPPAGSRGRAPGRMSGGLGPPEAEKMPCFLYFGITISLGTYVLNRNQTCLFVGGPRELGSRKQKAFLIWELGRTMEAANFGLCRFGACAPFDPPLV